MKNCERCALTPHETKADEMVSHYLLMFKSGIQCHCDWCEFAIRLINNDDVRKIAELPVNDRLLEQLPLTISRNKSIGD